MDSRELTFINDEFLADSVGEEDLERLLAAGWRHFGRYFFRYSIAIHQRNYRIVMPLRIRLEEFRLTKSLRRISRINSDLHSAIGPITFDSTVHRMFDLHKQRFNGMKPESIYHFLDPNADRVPTKGKELRLSYSIGETLAVSFFDETPDSLSGIYAMFDPMHSQRSLGIQTLLNEIDLAKESGKSFYYLGYAYLGESFYDYKKRFPGTEYFDWHGNWLPYSGQE